MEHLEKSRRLQLIKKQESELCNARVQKYREFCKQASIHADLQLTNDQIQLENYALNQLGKQFADSLARFGEGQHAAQLLIQEREALMIDEQRKEEERKYKENLRFATALKTDRQRESSAQRVARLYHTRAALLDAQRNKARQYASNQQQISAKPNLHQGSATKSSTAHIKKQASIDFSRSRLHEGPTNCVPQASPVVRSPIKAHSMETQIPVYEARKAQWQQLEAALEKDIENQERAEVRAAAAKAALVKEQSLQEAAQQLKRAATMELERRKKEYARSIILTAQRPKKASELQRIFEDNFLNHTSNLEVPAELAIDVGPAPAWHNSRPLRKAPPPTASRRTPSPQRPATQKVESGSSLRQSSKDANSLKNSIKLNASSSTPASPKSIMGLSSPRRSLNARSPTPEPRTLHPQGPLVITQGGLARSQSAGRMHKGSSEGNFLRKKTGGRVVFDLPASRSSSPKDTRIATDQVKGKGPRVDLQTSGRAETESAAIGRQSFESAREANQRTNDQGRSERKGMGADPGTLRWNTSAESPMHTGRSSPLELESETSDESSLENGLGSARLPTEQGVGQPGVIGSGLAGLNGANQEGEEMSAGHEEEAVSMPWGVGPTLQQLMAEVEAMMNNAIGDVDPHPQSTKTAAPLAQPPQPTPQPPSTITPAAAPALAAASTSPANVESVEQLLERVGYLSRRQESGTRREHLGSTRHEHASAQLPHSGRPASMQLPQTRPPASIQLPQSGRPAPTQPPQTGPSASTHVPHSGPLTSTQLPSGMPVYTSAGQYGTRANNVAMGEARNGMQPSQKAVNVGLPSSFGTSGASVGAASAPERRGPALNEELEAMAKQLGIQDWWHPSPLSSLSSSLSSLPPDPSAAPSYQRASLPCAQGSGSLLTAPWLDSSLSSSLADLESVSVLGLLDEREGLPQRRGTAAPVPYQRTTRSTSSSSSGGSSMLSLDSIRRMVDQGYLPDEILGMLGDGSRGSAALLRPDSVPTGSRPHELLPASQMITTAKPDARKALHLRSSQVGNAAEEKMQPRPSLSTAQVLEQLRSWVERGGDDSVLPSGHTRASQEEDFSSVSTSLSLDILHNPADGRALSSTPYLGKRTVTERPEISDSETISSVSLSLASLLNIPEETYGGVDHKSTEPRKAASHLPTTASMATMSAPPQALTTSSFSLGSSVSSLDAPLMSYLPPQKHASLSVTARQLQDVGHQALSTSSFSLTSSVSTLDAPMMSYLHPQLHVSFSLDAGSAQANTLTALQRQPGIAHDASDRQPGVAHITSDRQPGIENTASDRQPGIAHKGVGGSLLGQQFAAIAPLNVADQQLHKFETEAQRGPSSTAVQQQQLSSSIDSSLSLASILDSWAELGSAQLRVSVAAAQAPGGQWNGSAIETGSREAPQIDHIPLSSLTAGDRVHGQVPVRHKDVSDDSSSLSSLASLLQKAARAVYEQESLTLVAQGSPTPYGSRGVKAPPSSNLPSGNTQDSVAGEPLAKVYDNTILTSGANEFDFPKNKGSSATALGNNASASSSKASQPPNQAVHDDSIEIEPVPRTALTVTKQTPNVDGAAAPMQRASVLGPQVPYVAPLDAMPGYKYGGKDQGYDVAAKTHGKSTGLTTSAEFIDSVAWSPTSSSVSLTDMGPAASRPERAWSTSYLSQAQVRPDPVGVERVHLQTTNRHEGVLSTKGSSQKSPQEGVWQQGEGGEMRQIRQENTFSATADPWNDNPPFISRLEPSRTVSNPLPRSIASPIRPDQAPGLEAEGELRSSYQEITHGRMQSSLQKMADASVEAQVGMGFIEALSLPIARSSSISADRLPGRGAEGLPRSSQQPAAHASRDAQSHMEGAEEPTLRRMNSVASSSSSLSSSIRRMMHEARLASSQDFSDPLNISPADSLSEFPTLAEMLGSKAGLTGKRPSDGLAEHQNPNHEANPQPHNTTQGFSFAPTHTAGVPDIAQQASLQYQASPVTVQITIPSSLEQFKTLAQTQLQSRLTLATPAPTEQQQINKAEHVRMGIWGLAEENDMSAPHTVGSEAAGVSSLQPMSPPPQVWASLTGDEFSSMLNRVSLGRGHDMSFLQTSVDSDYLWSWKEPDSSVSLSRENA